MPRTDPPIALLLSTLPDAYTDRRLGEELPARGVAVRDCNADHLAATLHDGRFRLLDPEGGLLEPDAILHSWMGLRAGADVAAGLLGTGVLILNGPVATETASNKWRAALALARAGIEQPATAISLDPEHDRRLGEELGWPVVLKRIDGSGGESVFLARDQDELAAAADEIRRRAPLLPVLFQRFVPEAAGHDRRLFVVGGRLVGAMSRYGAPGDFRANCEQGGRAEPYTPSPQEAAAALAAVAAVGLDYGGVDLASRSEGPLVIEVNGEPGFEHMEAATGVSVAGAIADLLVERLAARDTARTRGVD